MIDGFIRIPVSSGALIAPVAAETVAFTADDARARRRPASFTVPYENRHRR